MMRAKELGGVAISARSRRSRTVSVGMLSMSLRQTRCRSFAGLHHVLRAANRRSRVHRHHLADHQPVEQHAHCG